MKRVEGKRALITGGARGIGAATAELLVEHGAHVIITDVLDECGRALAEKLGDACSYQHMDVSSESDWKKVMGYIVTEYGRLDIVFNNAGIIGVDGSFGLQDPEHATLESWHKIHAINLDGVFLGCKYGIELMKKNGGSIINMSSRSGIVGVPTAAAYASSKAAIRNHTKSVALYCASQNYNIRCNSLHPAAILTPIWDPMLCGNREHAIEQVARGIPLGHMGEPQDVAYVVLYLASDESKYVTGAEFTIDGGILAGSASAPGKCEDA